MIIILRPRISSESDQDDMLTCAISILLTSILCYCIYISFRFINIHNIIVSKFVILNYRYFKCFSEHILLNLNSAVNPFLYILYNRSINNKISRANHSHKGNGNVVSNSTVLSRITSLREQHIWNAISLYFARDHVFWSRFEVLPHQSCRDNDKNLISRWQSTFYKRHLRLRPDYRPFRINIIALFVWSFVKQLHYSKSQVWQKYLFLFEISMNFGWIHDASSFDKRMPQFHFFSKWNQTPMLNLRAISSYNMDSYTHQCDR